ncbi:MAG: aldo/keto reductase [archaeon]|nr:aldo/keto reductase [archaeon]
MENRLIKKTGDKVSPIGFGAMRLPKKNGKFDREKCKELIHYVIDNGVNFIDTASAYGNGDNEKLLGEILTGEYKDKVMISTKLSVYLITKEEDFEKILNKELERLQSNCIDYYFLHNIDLRTLRRIEKLNIYDFIEKAKKEGKIKHIGFSYHGSKDKFNEIIDSYDWDVVMVQYNYLDDNVQASIDGIRYAASKDIGIFVMEPLKGGILAGKMPDECESIFRKNDPNRSNADWALSWILNQPEITCVFSGMNDINQVKENVNIANKVKMNSVSPKEVSTINEVKEIMKEKLQINCATCGYCLPCPQGIKIPEIIKLYNEKYLFNEKGIITNSRLGYMTIAGGIMTDPAYASLCNKCGQCIRKCPMHLNIPKELKKVEKEFEIPGFKYFIKFCKHVGMPIFQLIGL